MADARVDSGEIVVQAVRGPFKRNLIRNWAASLARHLSPEVGLLKLGLEFFVAAGPGAVRDVALLDEDGCALAALLPELQDEPSGAPAAPAIGAVSTIAPGNVAPLSGTARLGPASLRIEIDQARLQVLHCAWMIDEVGAKEARFEISAIKVIAPQVACAVIDRAIEVFGGAGVSDDYVLAYFYAWARVLRIVDGPDAVHRSTVARGELKKMPPYVG